MHLSIIIVNYRTPALVIDCIDSIKAQTSNINYEVIVVDNASQDNSKEIVLAAHPDVNWIDMGYNAGFARGNNAGIRISKGDAVLLLNSDTLVLEEGVSKPFQLLMSSSYVACGVQLINADGSPQISGNYFMTGYLNNLLPLPIVGSAIKSVGKVFGVKKPHASRMNDVVEVDWINGAYLMVKTQAIARAGLLDEDFFLYAEEAEWCSRLRKIGKLAIFAKYKVVHLQGESANATFGSQSQGYYNLFDRKGLQIMVSNFVRLRKQHGVYWYLLHLFVYSGTSPIMFLSNLFAWPFQKQRGKQRLRASKGFAQNVLKLWRLTPTIIRNRPYFYKLL